MVPPYYAAALGLLFSVLSLRVILVRRRKNVGFGTDGDSDLERRIRVHANFAEYAPITLLLIRMAEWKGARPLWIHGLNLSLALGRLVHAIGLSRPEIDSLGRVAGMTCTQVALVGASLLCLVPLDR
jgi:uncharacterized protein